MARRVRGRVRYEMPTGMTTFTHRLEEEVGEYFFIQHASCAYKGDREREIVLTVEEFESLHSLFQMDVPTNRLSMLLYLRFEHMYNRRWA